MLKLESTRNHFLLHNHTFWPYSTQLLKGNYSLIGQSFVAVWNESRCFCIHATNVMWSCVTLSTTKCGLGDQVIMCFLYPLVSVHTYTQHYPIITRLDYEGWMLIAGTVWTAPMSTGFNAQSETSSCTLKTLPRILGYTHGNLDRSENGIVVLKMLSDYTGVSKRFSKIDHPQWNMGYFELNGSHDLITWYLLNIPVFLSHTITRKERFRMYRVEKSFRDVYRGPKKKT